MLLAGKRVFVTGVLTDRSIAYFVAGRAVAEGAEVVLSGFGRGLSLTERSAKRLGGLPVLELDITNAEHLERCRADLERRWGRVDGAVHAIGFAPEDALGGNFLATPWESVSTAFAVSAYSLKGLAAALAPLMTAGGGIVSLDFDARQAWAAYDWMGVCKAALESITRYLARDLGAQGVRVNCVAAGPLATVAAKSIPGFSGFEDAWARRAPLGWDASDPTAVAHMVCFLLSDYATMTTGELIHVDGGYHAMGSDLAR